MDVRVYHLILIVTTVVILCKTLNSIHQLMIKNLIAEHADMISIFDISFPKAPMSRQMNSPSLLTLGRISLLNPL